MRAFALDAFGQPGSIHDVPEPEPAEGQVRVRVAAASLNPFDNAVLAGYMKERMEHCFPLIPAGDFSGTVDAIGSGVTRYAVGDHIRTFPLDHAGEAFKLLGQVGGKLVITL